MNNVKAIIWFQGDMVPYSFHLELSLSNKDLGDVGEIIETYATMVAIDHPWLEYSYVTIMWTCKRMKR